ncbi:MAG: metallophosphoesterase [Elusimicrobiota bacterium]
MSPTAEKNSARERWRRRRAIMEADGRRHTRHGVVPSASPSRLLARNAARFLAFLGLRRRALENTMAVEINQVDLAVSGLPPAFEGYRILHLTDIHVDQVPGLMERAAERLRGASADLVVLTGDIQTFGGPSAVRAADVVNSLVSSIKARDGAVGVLGNHDGHGLVDALEERGIRMLINESVEMERSGAVLHIAGLDDVHSFYSVEAENALAARNADACSIALVHTPEIADLAAAAGYSLYLSGHTHGGQICLPGGRPLITMLDRHRRLAAGTWRWGSMTGYTSRGVGAITPARFNCPPEIALLRLRRENPAPQQRP